jgi:outer membrane lipoprotein-sorting protein
MSEFRVLRDTSESDMSRQKIEYLMLIEVGEKAWQERLVTVWLDRESQLPVQRQARLSKDEDILIAEEFSDWKLDERIDDATFELPKD